MGRPQVSFAKRQREQAKRERKEMKSARRAERKNDDKPSGPPIDTEVVAERPVEDDEVAAE